MSGFPYHLAVIDALLIANTSLGTRVLQRTWAEECVVYLVDSGDTHLLSYQSAQLLSLLQNGPLAFEALVIAFESLYDDSDRTEIVGLIGEIIKSLGKLGLIETKETLP